MAKLKDKVENGLNESRILILGAQVLLGFQYQAIFQTGFEKLPPLSQYLQVADLALLLVAVALLIAPAAYHRLVAKGEDTKDLDRFVTQITGIALLPFAVALGIDIYVAVEKVSGSSPAWLVGLAALLVAIFFWYGLEAVERTRHHDEIERIKSMADENQTREPGSTPLTTKVKQVLTEARIVLPGVQALLGFQLAVMLMDSFDRLTLSHKYVHLASLMLIAGSAIVLITPAAYHRIVEQGEDTERFLRFASRMVLAAMVLLGLGIVGDLYVVVDKVMQSRALAIASAVLMATLFFGLWFGFTAYRRNQLTAERIT